MLRSPQSGPHYPAAVSPADVDRSRFHLRRGTTRPTISRAGSCRAAVLSSRWERRPSVRNASPVIDRRQEFDLFAGWAGRRFVGPVTPRLRPGRQGDHLQILTLSEPFPEVVGIVDGDVEPVRNRVQSGAVGGGSQQPIGSQFFQRLRLVHGDEAGEPGGLQRIAGSDRDVLAVAGNGSREGTGVQLSDLDHPLRVKNLYVVDLHVRPAVEQAVGDDQFRGGEEVGANRVEPRPVVAEVDLQDRSLRLDFAHQSRPAELDVVLEDISMSSHIQARARGVHLQQADRFEWRFGAGARVDRGGLAIVIEPLPKLQNRRHVEVGRTPRSQVRRRKRQRNRRQRLLALQIHHGDLGAARKRRVEPGAVRAEVQVRRARSDRQALHDLPGIARDEVEEIAIEVGGVEERTMRIGDDFGQRRTDRNQQ